MPRARRVLGLSILVAAAFVAGSMLHRWTIPEQAPVVEESEEVSTAIAPRSSAPEPALAPEVGAAGGPATVALPVEGRAEPERFKFHPRDPHEWQGRRVNLSMMAICDGFCGLAMACIEGKCGPCRADADCGTNERCVLDHCLLSKNVECTRRDDCPSAGDSAPYCVIGGTGNGFRGNEELRSFCRGADGDNPDQARVVAQQRARDADARLAAPPAREDPLDGTQLKSRLSAVP